MKTKTLHNLAWITLFLIGMFSLIMGLTWILADKPWLLDKAANEAALQITFTKLFAADINQNLPSYLTVVYSFFGLWLTGLGMLICLYVLVTFMGTTKARNGILAVMAVFLVTLMFLEYKLIPISPFVNLSYGLLALYLVSLWASLKLNKDEQ